MPTYKYKREDGTTFEVRQSIKDDALEECPETGQKVKRVISGGGGVVYKGEGFYVNDYKNGSRKKKAESSQQENASGTSSDAESSDSGSTESSATENNSSN